MAYKNAPAGSRYTFPVSMDSFEECNSYGTAYTKPVAVFTNAQCIYLYYFFKYVGYSACDLFAANMQDSDAAIIIGEDG